MPQTAIGTVKYKYINTPALYAKNSSASEFKLSVVDLMFVTFVELQVFAHNRVFRKLTKLAIMAILASEALLREKNPVTKCYLQWD